MAEKQQKKKKGRSVQEFLGLKTFTKYGLATDKGELIFFQVSPTNISVLSSINIEIKIRHLMMVLLIGLEKIGLNIKMKYIKDIHCLHQ